MYAAGICEVTPRTDDVKGGCAVVARVKDGCRCGGHPLFTHRTQPHLWTNRQGITVY